MVNFMNVKWHYIFVFPTNYRLFKDKVLLNDNVLPGSCKEEKQMLKMLGVEYISYHVCPNDCILYRCEYADKEIYPKCGHDRYHKSRNTNKAHRPPHKILRHMPIIPRIQMFFHCKELAMLQGWHASHWSEGEYCESQ